MLTRRLATSLVIETAFVIVVSSAFGFTWLWVMAGVCGFALDTTRVLAERRALERQLNLALHEQRMRMRVLANHNDDDWRVS